MSKYRKFNRDKLKLKSISERKSKLNIEDISIDPSSEPHINGETAEEISKIEALAKRIVSYKKKKKKVILFMGAHVVKNGCSLLINDLIKKGIIDHVAVNGAFAIHDFEFARFGKSTECVKTYLRDGRFGIWDETGKFFAICSEKASKIDEAWGVEVGKEIFTNEDKYSKYSVSSICYQEGVPFTIHACVGQDIIYSHPWLMDINCSINDFLIFTESVRNLEGGIYLSVGSSIASPMNFEKALSMARNVEIRNGRTLKNFEISVNDLRKDNWNWSKSEPPMDNPSYYNRFMKTFHRIGCKKLEYHCIDNKRFLHLINYYINKEIEKKI